MTVSYFLRYELKRFKVSRLVLESEGRTLVEASVKDTGAFSEYASWVVRSTWYLEDGTSMVLSVG